MSFRKLFSFIKFNRKFTTDTTGIHFQKATQQPTPILPASSTSNKGEEVIKSGSTLLDRISACLVGIAIGYGYIFSILFFILFLF